MDYSEIISNSRTFIYLPIYLHKYSNILYLVAGRYIRTDDQEAFPFCSVPRND